jgi:hypothetical protein
MELMMGYWLQKEPIILAIDRTSWRQYNLLVVSWIIWLTDKSLEEEGERATPAVRRDLTKGKENQHSGERYHLDTPECQKIKIIFTMP